MLQNGVTATIFSLGVALTLIGTTGEATAHHVRRVGRSHAQSSHRPRFRGHFASADIAHVIQCVAFAREDAGIELSGNARDWWDNAAGLYARGERPEAGSVLSFLANGHMPLGHVAVVSSVEDNRTIVIDQSHWNSRGITRDIEVKDVSENNDWTAVRVQLAGTDAFGSIYPTHGFIYPRPDTGNAVPGSYQKSAMIAQAASSALDDRRANSAPVVEVAELPHRGTGLDLTLPIPATSVSRSQTGLRN